MLTLLTWRRTPTQTGPAVQDNDSQPKRPDDLAIRFSTVGGCYVDVTGHAGYRSDHYRWVCHGCKARSNFPEESSLDHMRRGGNDHANHCRAIPL